MAHPELDSWEHEKRNKEHYHYPHFTDMHGNAIRQASKGKFRVVAEDHEWYRDDWVICEYATLLEAQECADAHFRERDTWYFVYDDAGVLVYTAQGKKDRWQN